MSQNQTVSVTDNPVTWAGVVQAASQYVAFFRNDFVMPPPEIRLTQQQLDAVRKVLPVVDTDSCPGAVMLGTPIVLVDSVEKSTPYRCRIREDRHDPGA